MRENDNLSLRSRIVIGGVAIVLVPLVFVSALIYSNSVRALTDISTAQMYQRAQSLAAMVQDSVQRELEIIQEMAMEPSVVTAVQARDYEGLDELLHDVFTKVGRDYEGLAYFDSSGVIRADGVDKSRIGISIAARNYFKDSMKGKSGFGPVTPSLGSGWAVFSVC